MKVIDSILRFVNQQLGDVSSQMDGTGWCVVAVAALIVGYLLLRGNSIRST